VNRYSQIHIFSFLLLYLCIPCIYEVHCCTTTVVCTETGPPRWTYDYFTTGSSIDAIKGFKLSGVDGVTDTGAPGLFMGMTGSSEVVFEVFGCGTMCGTDHPGFWIEATDPGVVNGTVDWGDLAFLSSGGTINGPIFHGTPGPTPSLTTVPLPGSSSATGTIILMSLFMTSILFYPVDQKGKIIVIK